MDYVFGSPVVTVHGENSHGETVKFPHVSASGGSSTLAQTAAQVNKLLSLIGATFVEDQTVYRVSREDVIGDGEQ